MSLCKTCKWRYRRAFMPHKPEEYGDSEVVITNICILSEMDLSDSDTIDCNRYEREDD